MEDTEGGHSLLVEMTGRSPQSLKQNLPVAHTHLWAQPEGPRAHGHGSTVTTAAHGGPLPLAGGWRVGAGGGARCVWRPGGKRRPREPGRKTDATALTRGEWTLGSWWPRGGGEGGSREPGKAGGGTEAGWRVGTEAQRPGGGPGLPRVAGGPATTVPGSSSRLTPDRGRDPVRGRPPRSRPHTQPRAG